VSKGWSPGSAAAAASKWQSYDDPKTKIVGYCLYRSEKNYAAKDDPTCKLCERVTSIAIDGTTCVDDLVKAGNTYYYVVTAAALPEAKGKPVISPSSNEAAAKIPKKPNSKPPVSSLPRCRPAAGETDMLPAP